MTSPLPAAEPLTGALGNVAALEFLESKRQQVRDHYNRLADRRLVWFRRNRYYYSRLTDFLRFVVEPKRRVLQLRSDTGHMLAAVEPSYGVGVDVSEKLVDLARRLHPQLEFQLQDPEMLCLEGSFDYIIVNSVNDIVDIQAAFLRLRDVTHADTRILVLGCSHLWRPLVRLAEAIRLKVPQPAPNWLSCKDVENLLALTGFEVIRTYGLFLLPVHIAVLSDLCNRVLARLPFLRALTFLYGVVARKVVRQDAPSTVSVVVPCKNERGNVEAAVRRIPEIGARTEIILCDDRSTDGTRQEVRRVQNLFPGRDIKLVVGPGTCKAANVRAGFEAATGDVLMILDADLSVMPEELRYFYQVLVERKAEFVNGSRMVYPMQQQAMRGLNILGNTLFSWAFTFILGQRIKDTLCGTKVLWRKDYERLKHFRGSWGVDDRWGDYELLFGAARLHLKIVDLPVHYMERFHGETKMKKRLANAVVMARMCWAALFTIKFV